MVAGGAERAYGDEYYDGAFLCVLVCCCVAFFAVSKCAEMDGGGGAW
jgi:hypothetical protein